MYHQSPSRVKTLDILAKATPYEEQSAQNLIKFCQFARSDGQGSTAAECAQFLMDRYDWVIDSESDEFLSAWYTSGKDFSKPVESESSQQSLIAPNPTPNRVRRPCFLSCRNKINSYYVYKINVIMKKDAFAKTTLLCQANDANLKFIGDSGAIGRLTADPTPNTVTIDLKGINRHSPYHTKS